MKYTFNEKDEQSSTGFKTIEVKPERWAWGVIYRDGSELKQFGDDGQFHQFREINQAEINGFVMYKLDEMDRRIDIAVEKHMQIFHFYRNFILHAGTEIEQRLKVYCFGWKNRDNGQANYFYILPDDKVVVADHDIQIIK